MTTLRDILIDLIEEVDTAAPLSKFDQNAIVEEYMERVKERLIG